MARMTIRIPDSLHEALASRAEAEGVSMNQFVVFALSQATALEAVKQQRQRFDELRSQVSQAEAEEALQALLDSRS